MSETTTPSVEVELTPAQEQQLIKQMEPQVNEWVKVYSSKNPTHSHEQAIQYAIGRVRQIPNNDPPPTVVGQSELADRNGIGVVIQLENGERVTLESGYKLESYIQPDEAMLELGLEIAQEITSKTLESQYLIANDRGETVGEYLNSLGVDYDPDSHEFMYQTTGAVANEAIRLLGRVATGAGISIGASLAIGSILGFFTGGMAWGAMLPMGLKAAGIGVTAAKGGAVGRLWVGGKRLWDRAFGKGRELRRQIAEAVIKRVDEADRLAQEVLKLGAEVRAGNNALYPKFMEAMRNMMEKASTIGGGETKALEKREQAFNREERGWAMAGSLAAGGFAAYHNFMAGVGSEAASHTAQTVAQEGQKHAHELAVQKVNALIHSGRVSDVTINFDTNPLEHAVQFVNDRAGGHFHIVLSQADIDAAHNAHKVLTSVGEAKGHAIAGHLHLDTSNIPGRSHDLEYQSVVKALTDKFAAQFLSQGASTEVSHRLAFEGLKRFLEGAAGIGGAYLGTEAASTIDQQFAFGTFELGNSGEGRAGIQRRWDVMRNQWDVSQADYNKQLGELRAAVDKVAPPEPGEANGGAMGDLRPGDKFDLTVKSEYDYSSPGNTDPQAVSIARFQGVQGTQGFRLVVNEYDTPASLTARPTQKLYTLAQFNKLLNEGSSAAKRIYRQGEPTPPDQEFLKDHEDFIERLRKYKPGDAVLTFNQNITDKALETLNPYIDKDTACTVWNLRKLTEDPPKVTLAFVSTTGPNAGIRQYADVDFRTLMTMINPTKLKAISETGTAASVEDGDAEGLTEVEKQVEAAIQARENMVVRNPAMNHPPLYRIDPKQAYEVEKTAGTPELFIVTGTTDTDVTLQKIAIFEAGHASAGQPQSDAKGVKLDRRIGNTIHESKVAFAKRYRSFEGTYSAISPTAPVF